MGADSSKLGEKFKLFNVTMEIKLAVASRPNTAQFINLENMTNEAGVSLAKILLKEMNSTDFFRIFKRKGPRLAVSWPLEYESSSRNSYGPISLKSTGRNIYFNMQICCNLSMLVKKEGLPNAYKTNVLSRVEWLITDLCQVIEASINKVLNNEYKAEKYVVMEVIPTVKEGPDISEEKVFDAVLASAKKSGLAAGFKNEKLEFLPDDAPISCKCF